MSDLFRNEAVQAATSRLEGKVMFRPLLGIWVFAGLLAMVILGGAAFLATADYARKEPVLGWIIPEEGVVRAVALRGGVVTDVFVEPGQSVRENDRLLSIRLSTSTSNGDVTASLDEALQAQFVATQRTAEVTLDRLDLEELRLARLISGRNQEVGSLDAQISAQRERLEQARQNEEWARKNFEEGLATRADAEGWEELRRQAEQDLLGLERSLFATLTQIADLSRQIERVSTDREAAVAENEQAMAALTERSVRIVADGEYVLTAPVDGRIDVLPVDRGQVLAQGATGAIISPNDSVLIAELFVSSRAVGFMQEEQLVHLKYDAFPFQRFGTGLATIVEISNTILQPNEVTLGGMVLQEPVFRVRARMHKHDIEAYGEEIELRSGMTLTADVIVDERSLIEWLLDPLYAAGRGA